MPTFFFADLIREVSYAGGTGPLTLAGALPGHRSFAATVPPGALFHYSIAGVAHQGEWEVGTGVLAGDGALVRSNIAASSAGNSAVPFTEGLKIIALTVSASWFDAQQDVAEAIEAALAAKQPLSTGHAAIAVGTATDLVTVRRGDDWFNLPLEALMRRDANGRFAAGSPLILAVDGNEQMRIAANGNVGIGTSNPSERLHILLASGGSWTMLRLQNTQSGAGCFVSMTNGAGNDWDFGVGGGNGFQIRAGGTIRIAFDAFSFSPGGDAAMDFGSPWSRWKNSYFSVSPTVTSDERQKKWRGVLNEVEMRAARRIAGEIGIYQWLASIAEKGEDKARLHVGVRAQAVWAIMAEEGLVDPIGADGKPGKTPYAFLCWDEWGDDVSDAANQRKAGERFGVRVDQLALFIAAAQEQRLTALEQAI